VQFCRFCTDLQTSAEGETTVVSLCFIYRTILYEISRCQIICFFIIPLQKSAGPLKKADFRFLVIYGVVKDN
ncbi:hypothetical protein BpHYR1_047430, partial [Brachionus plicatilis]